MSNKILSTLNIGNNSYEIDDAFARQKIAEVDNTITEMEDKIDTLRDDYQTVTESTAQATELAVEAKENADRIYTDVLKSLPIDSASGTIVSFTDGADNIPLKSFVVGINLIQNGNGDPSPENIRPISGWTGANIITCGKNILMNTAKSHTTNHVIYNVNADGSITANETATGGNGRCDILNVNNPSKVLLDILSGKKLAGCPEGGGTKTYLIQLIINGTVICRDMGSGVQIPDLSQYYGATNLYVDASVRTNHTAENLVFKPMISEDANYDTYEPYSGESIVITFPNEAETVYGGTLDVTSGVLTVNKGFISSYNGESLPSTWISDRDVYTEDGIPTVGAEVIYILSKPVTYQLTPTEVKSMFGINNIYADCGNVSVEYRADTTIYINRKIAEAINALT